MASNILEFVRRSTNPPRLRYSDRLTHGLHQAWLRCEACLQRDLQLLLGEALLQGAVQLAQEPLHRAHMDHDGAAPHIDASLAQVLMRDLLRVLGPFPLGFIAMLCGSLPSNLRPAPRSKKSVQTPSQRHSNHQVGHQLLLIAADGGVLQSSDRLR